MHTYELVLVFDPALEMEQIDQDLRKLNEVISANGTIRRWERWGKRRLSFEIAGRQYGYYVLSVFDSQTSAVAELDRLIRIN
ncbi:30S ribosomal protein S6, partial [bacterium]|nr:30S ribosomal protein S6 [bacterium]